MDVRPNYKLVNSNYCKLRIASHIFIASQYDARYRYAIAICPFVCWQNAGMVLKWLWGTYSNFIHHLVTW